MGGEPTLHPQFREIVRMVSDGWVGMVTNGRAFSIESFSNIIKDAKIDFFVKLSGIGKVHDQMTRADGSYKQTIAGIKNLVRHKRRVFVLYEMTEQNFVFIKDAAEKFNKIGVAGIIIRYAPTVDFEKLSFRFSDAEKVIKEAFLTSNKRMYLYGFPICCYKFISDHIHPEFFGKSAVPDTGYSRCSNCMVSDRCFGVSGEYAAYYGDGEISALVDSPSEICIEVTSDCNLECKKCFNNTYYDKICSIDFDDFRRFISRIPEGFTRQIRLTGGEPMLHKDIYKMFDTLEGYKIYLNTNAVCITKDSAERIAENVENVLVSLNGFDRETEKSATGRDVFSAKMEGIRLLVKAGVKVVRAGTVATRFNVDNLEKFYSLVIKLGLDDWELYRPIETDCENMADSADVMVRCAEKLNMLNNMHGKNFRIANAVPFCIHEDVCKVSIGARADDGHNRFVIGADGIARPSYFISENLGTIRDSPEKIWNNPFLRKMRSFLPDRCKGCVHANLCMGGSRYFAKLCSGSYFMLDPMATQADSTRLVNTRTKRVEIGRGDP